MIKSSPLYNPRVVSCFIFHCNLNAVMQVTITVTVLQILRLIALIVWCLTGNLVLSGEHVPRINALYECSVASFPFRSIFTINQLTFIQQLADHLKHLKIYLSSEREDESYVNGDLVHLL